MSEPQVTMNGPARLRQSADLGSLFPDELRQLAALWEADLERAARDHDLAMSIMAERLTRAERAEARAEELGRRLASKAMALQEAEESVDRLQASKAELQIEIKDLYAQRNTATADCAASCGENERLSKAAGPETVDGAIAAIEAQRAALERARALLVEQAEVVIANVWHIPPEYSSRNAVLDAAVKMRELAAALGSGGAA